MLKSRRSRLFSHEDYLMREIEFKPLEKESHIIHETSHTGAKRKDKGL